MKKNIIIIASTILILGLGAGIAAAAFVNDNKNRANAQTKAYTDNCSATSGVGIDIGKDASASANTDNTSKQAQNNPDVPLIGENKAKEIALERAGLTAEEVIFDRVELDRDDGVLKYELEFRKGSAEYDVEIRADDGTVLSFERDIFD